MSDMEKLISSEGLINLDTVPALISPKEILGLLPSHLETRVMMHLSWFNKPVSLMALSASFTVTRDRNDRMVFSRGGKDVASMLFCGYVMELTEYYEAVPIGCFNGMGYVFRGHVEYIAPDLTPDELVFTVACLKGFGRFIGLQSLLVEDMYEKHGYLLPYFRDIRAGESVMSAMGARNSKDHTKISKQEVDAIRSTTFATVRKELLEFLSTVGATPDHGISQEKLDDLRGIILAIERESLSDNSVASYLLSEGYHKMMRREEAPPEDSLLAMLYRSYIVSPVAGDNLFSKAYRYCDSRPMHYFIYAPSKTSIFYRQPLEA